MFRDAIERRVHIAIASRAAMDATDDAVADSSPAQPNISDAAKKDISGGSLGTGSSREIESEVGSLQDKSRSKGSNSRPRIHSAYMSQVSQGIDTNFPSLDTPHHRSGTFGDQARNSTYARSNSFVCAPLSRSPPLNVFSCMIGFARTASSPASTHISISFL